MPVIYNYACDDALLWIVMVYCELRGVRYTGQISKKGGIGSFAKYNTRQRDALPSVDPKHSAKRPISVILGIFFAECFVFAECIQMDIRQSDHKNMPVARLFAECIGRDTALGKVCNLCRVL